jgi:hypothetical protein
MRSPSAAGNGRCAALAARGSFQIDGKMIDIPVVVRA